MPITLTCPCGKTLRVADEHAGKRVKCPICNAIIEPPPPEPVFEVVENTAPKPLSTKPRDDDEDDEGGGYAMEAPVETPDPPRPKPVFLKRADDEEEDERPRRRSGAREGAEAGRRLAYIVGGALGLVIGIGLAVWGNSGEGRGATKLLIFGVIIAIGGLVSLVQGLTGNLPDEE